MAAVDTRVPQLRTGLEGSHAGAGAVAAVA